MITPQELADAFNAAGIDDTTKLAEAINGFAISLQIKKIDIQIDALAKKQVDALTPIANERIDLLNQRNALTDTINPTK